MRRNGRGRAADKDSRLTGHFDQCKGSLFIFAQTNGIVDKTGGYFVWNLSCDRLLSAGLEGSRGVRHNGGVKRGET